MSRIAQIDSQRAVGTVDARFIKDTRHPVFAGCLIRQRTSVVRQHLLDACSLDQFVDACDVATIWTVHASGSYAEPRYIAADCMPNRNIRRQITPRDLDLFTAIDRHPLTAEQLLKLSETFVEAFTDVRLLRRRLRQLREAGFIQDWPYATAARGGSPHYWKLTRGGYRLLHGEDAVVPTRRYFEAIAPGHHPHTQAIGDFLVHLLVAVYREGSQLRHFARENATKIEAGEFTLYPDCAFQIVHDGQPFNFLVEVDNSTESVRSKAETESIERKLRGYDLHQSRYAANDPSRYVVLFITTRSTARLNHILDLAALIQNNRQRRVFVGAGLTEFLSCENPLRRPILRDHRGLKLSLVPQVRPRAKSQRTSLTFTTAPC